MTYEYLNPYISKSGKQVITLSLKPLDTNARINQETLKEISLEIYSSENGENPPFKKIQVLKLPEYKESQKSIFYTWTFDVEVPFEINTLDDAKDLKSEKPQELLKDVVAEYEKVHILINSGEIATYMQLYKKSREREMISMYYDENKQNEYLSSIKQRSISSKGFMQPLSDYNLLIHPNNKIVSLVNKMGKSPLFSKDEMGKIKTYGLQLYRSTKTGKLEIY